jgi:hypothetical protein
VRQQRDSKSQRLSETVTVKTINTPITSKARQAASVRGRVNTRGTKSRKRKQHKYGALVGFRATKTKV